MRISFVGVAGLSLFFTSSVAWTEPLAPTPVGRTPAPVHAQSAPASASGTVAVERFSNISGAPDSARVVILVTTSPAGASGDDAAGAR